MSSLIGLTSPREAPNTHYMMLHWGLLFRLTTKVVPQVLYIIMTSRKEVNVGILDNTKKGGESVFITFNN